MNLLGSARATRNTDFVDRVKAAVVMTAQDILNDPSMKGLRKHYSAGAVMENPDSHIWINQFAWRVAANAAVAGTVEEDGSVAASDNDIHSVVAGAWDQFFPEIDPPTVS